MEQRLFLSWAHDDVRLKTSLLRLLKPHLQILKGLTPVWWEDSNLAVGEKWRAAIARRLVSCDLGIHLVSPALLASDFSMTYEVPPFYGPRPIRPGIPVGLDRVQFNDVDSGGIADRQVFLHRSKFFAELSGVARSDFARELALSIRSRATGCDTWSTHS